MKFYKRYLRVWAGLTLGWTIWTFAQWYYVKTLKPLNAFLLGTNIVNLFWIGMFLKELKHEETMEELMDRQMLLITELLNSRFVKKAIDQVKPEQN